jgi:ketol-acid reductoisomerase
VLKLRYDRDLDPTLIRSRTVAIIGYGNQGHAHALNLRDSGVRTLIGARPESASGRRAVEAGFSVLPTSEAVGAAELVMVLAPDEAQPAIFSQQIAPALKPGAALAFAHGFSVHFGLIVAPPTVDVVMAAPMGAGHLLRKEYQRGAGVPCLVAVAQDASGQALELALSYAGAIGGGRAGIIETSFKEECETDLFSEQAVLCGGMSALILAAFETLTEAGYAPEMAYFCCVHELRFIVELIQERGIAGMRGAISGTARYGDLTRGPRIIDAGVKQHLREILGEIRRGDFAKEWMAENAAGRPRLDALDHAAKEHPIEPIGGPLREMMSFLKKENR